MSNRSWFYAANGQQQGPFPEAQLRDLITRGTVRADTLVWSEGMAGWQRAGEIPGLIPAAGAPPAVPAPGAPPPVSAGGGYGGGGGGYGGGPLSADLPVFPLLGRAIVYVIGFLLVIPAPWVAVWFYKWAISRITVPGRPNLSFNGQVGDIWYAFIALALLSYVGQADFYGLQFLAIIAEAFLGWMIIRWIVGNLSSNGEPLPIRFNGSPLVYVAWSVLMLLSIITIIGWAWVLAAWMRWNCRNIEGTQREVIFNGSGLEILWRSIVFVIGCAFLIPIPWVLRWYATWVVSQFALAERGAHAAA